MDVGEARIGVAASDAGGVIVIPIETVPTHPLGKSIRRIVAMAIEREAIEIVVGLPRNMGGNEGPSAQSARKYAKRLADSLKSVRVCLIDERLSTMQAHNLLGNAGLDSRRQRSVVDQVAAQIILERALEVERSTGALPGEEVRPTQTGSETAK